MRVRQVDGTALGNQQLQDERGDVTKSEEALGRLLRLGNARTLDEWNRVVDDTATSALRAERANGKGVGA